LDRRLEVVAQNAFDGRPASRRRLIALARIAAHGGALNDPRHRFHRRSAWFLAAGTRGAAPAARLQIGGRSNGSLSVTIRYSIERREQIRPSIQRAARRLLRDMNATLPLMTPAPLLAFLLSLGDAKVGQLDLALLADETLLGLNVAMKRCRRLAAARLAVRERQRPANLAARYSDRRSARPCAGARPLDDLVQVHPSTSSSTRK